MPDPMKERIRDLTPRLREVVRLISLGCTVIETAAILGIDPSTVDNHRQAAYYTLGVSKATHLTRIAIKYRISSLSDELTRSEKRKMKRGKR